MRKPETGNRKLETDYRPVIGLEVHVQAKTRSKMFCGCPADTFGKKPNSVVCPVCLGLPGAIPVPNRAAIEKTIALAKALGCRITKFSQFERKNYFYPDLPKGFQISQYEHPIGVEGKLLGFAVSRVHLEEDTGKLLHEGGQTFIDFNRSGVPLVEIVTEPEFEDPARVSEFLKELRLLVVNADISDADMEKGSMRLEANVSLKKSGSKKLPGYKVELKNINSFAFLKKALEVEIERQGKLLKSGKQPHQETRGFDPKRGVTVAQRTKEEAFDYRYFPEPDIPPLEKILVQKVTRTKTITADAILVESPEKIREKYRSQGLSAQYTEVLVGNPKLARIFEEVSAKIPADEAANIIVNRRFGDPLRLGVKKLIAAYEKERKKEVLSGDKLLPTAKRVVADNPRAVSDYRQGKTAALKFLLGQLMRETDGKMDPKVGELILKKLCDART
ncbi:Asp-tRNA(Asn)/Glu-tRNA(Gln) amidotransferase subunit GatB [Candidatus Saccharibacteria bacterium]|nr:Asp-tRNA(Asn)/Glu-tRNA(Gln) amidotransferase subunit GatB [Candidatus Saccharibacteria bacterium]